MGQCVLLHIAMCVCLHGGYVCLGDGGGVCVHEDLNCMGCLYVTQICMWRYVCVAMHVGWAVCLTVSMWEGCAEGYLGVGCAHTVGSWVHLLPPSASHSWTSP